MIVILEGVDGGGKSTLIEWMENEYRRNKVFTKVYTTHHGPYPDLRNPSMKYLASMRRRQHGGQQNELVLLDRSWISEPIYGKALRKGVDRVGTASARMLERVALKAGVYVVICEPSYEVVQKNWSQRKNVELVQVPEHLELIYKLYKNVKTGLLCDFYNYEHDEQNKLVLTSTIKQMMDYRPPATGIGSWSADSTLIVGTGDGLSDLPFVNFNQTSISQWLTLELESIGVQEHKLYWVDPTDLSPDFIGRSDAPTKALALGKAAGDWCQAVGLDHKIIEDPQRWRKMYSTRAYEPLEEFFHAE